MKIFGMMLTCNEIEYLHYSLQSVLPHVEKLLVYDVSTDGSKEYLKTIDKVVLFNEEDHPELISLADKRQFLLERGRELGGTHYVCMDADEVLSRSLEKHLHNLLALLEEGQTCSVPWFHVINDKFDCVQGAHSTQCLLFYDHFTLSYINTTENNEARNHTHEYRSPCKYGNEKLLNKVIIDRYPLFHFGRDDLNYLEWKNVRSMIGEYIDGHPIDQINFRYLTQETVSMSNVASPIDLNLLPQIVDNKITMIQRNPELIKNSIKTYIRTYNVPNKILYDLDIIRNTEILNFFTHEFPGFNKKFVRWINSGDEIYQKRHYYQLLVYTLEMYTRKEGVGVIYHILDFIRFDVLRKIFRS